MANWKKVIVSGSAAELASLQLDTALPVAQGGIGASSLTDKAVLISQDSGTDAVGSLALTSNGSLIIGGSSGPAVEAASDLAGSGLAATTGDGTLALSVGGGTGIDVAADAISVDVSDFMTNGSDNRIITATGADAMNAEANLTFDGSGLSVTGHVTASGNVSGSTTSTGSFGELHIDDKIGLGTADPDTELYIKGGATSGAITATTGTNKGILHIDGGVANNSKYMITFGNQSTATTSSPIGVMGVHNNHSAGAGLFFGLSTSYNAGINRIPLAIEATSADGLMTLNDSGVTVAGSIISTTGNISGSAASTGSFGLLQGDGREITNLPVTAINNATADRLVTIGSTTTELDGESNLTWNGSVLAVGTSSPALNQGLHVKTSFINSVARFESGDAGVSITLKDNVGMANFDYDGSSDTLHIGDASFIPRLTISATKISGSATSTGSFGFITGSKIQGTFLGDGNSLDLSSNSTIGSNIFSTVAVSGQSNIVADSNSDTLTLAESTGLGITTNAGNDTVTFALDSAQTTIQTIFNTGLIVGRASGDTTIDFTADDVIVFDAGSSEKMRVDTSGVDITGVLTVSSNATIQGDLVVNGSTTTLSTTNLAVGDQFIFAATGSAGSNVDAGLVVQSGSAANTGSAFYHDIDSQRWAVAKTVASNAVAVTPNQFVGTITLNSNPPSNSDGEYGVGEMWIETDTQDIFIRTG